MTQTKRKLKSLRNLIDRQRINSSFLHLCKKLHANDNQYVNKVLCLIIQVFQAPNDNKRFSLAFNVYLLFCN